ncbi:MAG: hypothetical protein IIB00_05430 [candidate division Zixibacteria bacterium]|nr:hypothetical protein [candidate division Zixibacteria bacterium]
MAEKYPQTFENHFRFVPLYHFVVFGVFFVNLIWSIVRVVQNFSYHSAFLVLVAIALILLFYFTRAFALKVQDRVIRLEMSVRLERILPDDLKSRIDELTPDQLISLRFASNSELPGLCRKILEEKITDRKEIKKLIKDWQGDYLRV